MSLWSVTALRERVEGGKLRVQREPEAVIARLRRRPKPFIARRSPKNKRRELNSRTPWIPGRGSEKFLKREFLAENGGKQPVSAEPSEERTANKNAPHRQPALAAKTPTAAWTLNTQKTCQPPVSLATESRPPMTATDDGDG